MPYFDEHAADIACNFFEVLLKHTVDEYYGKPFILAPWEEDAVRNIYGWKNDDGTRLIKLAYLEVPKKAGKTEFCAGIVLMSLVLDPNPGCQVYGAAAATKQALNVYRAACKMVEQEPQLSRRLRILRGTNRIIKRSDPDAFYAAIAADGDFSDGMNPAVVIADEVHRWRTRKQLENWDVLTKSGITRTERLGIAITTAGVKSESPLAWRLHEKVDKIRSGVFTDPTFYGRIYSADPGDDWTQESTWIKANPSLKVNGGFLEISKLREIYEASLSDPEEQRAFRRYFLNLWDEKANRAIDMKHWHACVRDWDAHGLIEVAGAEIKTLPHDLLRRFVDRKCWVGVDLSLTTDLSAVSCVFPRDDGGYDVLPFPFMPEEGIRKMELRDGMPYRQWAESGWLEVSPGRLVDYGDVRKRILWAREMFNVQQLCFDRYNSREMSTQLADIEGIPCVEISQNFTGMSEPTKKLITLVAAGKLSHGGHPVLTHHASCLCLKSDGNDLVRPIKPDREKESSRIDLITATIDALASAIVTEVQGPSIYDNPATCAV